MARLDYSTSSLPYLYLTTRFVRVGLFYLKKPIRHFSTTRFMRVGLLYHKKAFQTTPHNPLLRVGLFYKKANNYTFPQPALCGLDYSTSSLPYPYLTTRFMRVGLFYHLRQNSNSRQPVRWMRDWIILP